MEDLINSNRVKMKTYSTNFHMTFGVPLQRFMHPVLGFDVVAFDTWLKVPDGISTNDIIIERYGEEACQMVYNLL